MERTEEGLVITAADCGPGLFWLIFSRRERWFWCHRACRVDKSSHPREHFDLFFCSTHGKSWADVFR